MKITLVRHTSVACGTAVCYGQSDVDVAESFVQEAETVKNRLDGKRFDYVYTSPLQRCTRLAGYCGYPDAMTDNRLLELNFGDWEGVLWSEIKDENIDKWYADWINTRTTNGESFADQVKRVENFMYELKLSGYRDVLIFTHAGVIRAFAILLGLIDIKLAFSDYQVAYGEIKTLEI